jgi:tRNA dimethylallyltransferase
MMITTRRAVAVMGATATGKSALAVRLAERFGGEIISMDSRQVYRGLDIGTGKVSPEETRRVPHHLIDILDPGEVNSAGAHAARAEAVAGSITGRGKPVFYAGGTGLYFRVLFRGLIDAATPEDERERLRGELDGQPTEALYRRLFELDRERADSLAPRDRVRIVRAIEVALLTGRTWSEHVAVQRERPPWPGLKVVLTLPRPALRKRIAERTREMYAKGWADEVRSLIAAGVGLDAPAMGSLGYDVIARAILSGEDPGATRAEVTRLTQQYAKRQETFFRSEPDALWFDVSNPGTFAEIERLTGAHFGL